MIIIVTSSSISVDQIASGRHFSTTSIDSPTTVFFGPGSWTCPEFARLGDNQRYIRVIYVIFRFDFCWFAHHYIFGPGNSCRPEFAKLGDCWKYIRVICVIFLFDVFFPLYFLLHNEPVQAQSVLTQSTVKSSNFSRQLWQIHATNATNHMQI